MERYSQFREYQYRPNPLSVQKNGAEQYVFTLKQKTFFHLIDNDMSFLIQRVIFLAHSVCASIGQAYRQDCAVTHKLHIGARAGYMCLECQNFQIFAWFTP